MKEEKLAKKRPDRFAGDFETVTDTVWPARGIQRTISAVLTAANADAKIDEMLRGVEAGASPAHTGTRHSDHELTEDVAPESSSGARARRDPAAFSSNNLEKGPHHHGDADPFASPPPSPLTGRRRPRDESSEDGATTRA